jgi:transcriptional regulator with XRE-family HTH domain
MFKNRVREMRKAKWLTIQELADKVGRGFSTIQKLDTGTVDLDTYWMEILSQALDCEPWELLPKEMQPNISPEEMEIIRAVRKAKEVTAKTNEISATGKAS